MNQLLIQRIYPHNGNYTILNFKVEVNDDLSINPSSYDKALQNSQSATITFNDLQSSYDLSVLKTIQHQINNHGNCEITRYNNHYYIFKNNGLKKIKTSPLSMVIKYSTIPGILFALLIPSLLSICL